MCLNQKPHVVHAVVLTETYTSPQQDILITEAKAEARGQNFRCKQVSLQAMQTESMHDKLGE